MISLYEFNFKETSASSDMKLIKLPPSPIVNRSLIKPEVISLILNVSEGGVLIPPGIASRPTFQESGLEESLKLILGSVLSKESSDGVSFDPIPKWPSVLKYI